MADALTSGFKTYGEIRTRIGVIIAVVVAMCFCICGWMTVLAKDKHTAKTSGILSNVNCSANTCTATASYGMSGSPSPSPSPAPYNFTSTWGAGMTDGKTVNVYYDPANPSDASVGPVPKLLGWTFIGVATLLILFSFLFMKFFSGLSNQGKAVVGGFEAASDVSSFFSKN